VSRYRLYPRPAQEAALLGHCAHARFVWNLAVEQRSWWQPGRPGPEYIEQARQLTEARAAHPWLAEGPQMVQQQALRDFHAAWSSFFAALAAWREQVAKLPPDERGNPPAPPSWRKRGVHAGFRIVAVGPHDMRRLNRHWGEVVVPKLGWVRFRWSRAVPQAKSYRITRDRAGRWHVAFAVVPPAIPAPGNGQAVGVDRGVAVSAALSTGELLRVPGLRPAEVHRLRLLERPQGPPAQGVGSPSPHRRCHRHAEGPRNCPAARLDREGLHRPGPPVRPDRGRGLGRAGDDQKRPGHHATAGPGRPAESRTEPRHPRGRLGQAGRPAGAQSPGRVVKVPAAYTSQRCWACGHVARENRESQPAFRCVACGFTGHADWNASLNILAVGRAVAARGGLALAEPVNREPPSGLVA
jgi:putative transposase